MTSRDGGALLLLVVLLAMGKRGAPSPSPSPSPPPPSPKPPGGAPSPSPPPSPSPSPTPGKRVLGRMELRALASRAGFAPETQAAIAAAIAIAESSGHVDAVGDQGESIGLWQIHVPDHPEYDREKLKDPDYNAHAAYVLSKQGSDFSPWTTYRNGAYRAFLA